MQTSSAQRHADVGERPGGRSRLPQRAVWVAPATGLLLPRATQMH
jgi:hypothetical protein